MKHRAYPKYKSSGINWIGDIPEGWTIDRIKASVKSCNNGIWGDEPAGDSNDTICVRVADFNRDNLSIDISDPTLRNISEREKSNRTLRKGDLLVEKSGGGENQPVGCVVLYSHDTPAVCSNFIAKMSLKDGMNPAFWKYLHAAAYSIRLTVGSINQTSGIQNLDQDRYFNEKVPFPSLEEQQKIANFLDRETAKIDELIQRQEKLIELVNEERMAIISNAVTKGLNSSIQFKNSGIEWIGLIPEHWQVGGLTKFIGPIVDYRGRTPIKTDDGMFLVTARNIKNGQINYLASKEYVDASSAESLLARGRPEIGDVLFTMEAPLGEVALIDRVDIALAQRIVKFRGLKNTISNKFLLYWLMSNFCQARLTTLATGSTALGIKASKLSQIEFIVPPYDEQLKIVEFLDKKIEKTDALASKSKKSIQLLKEHRVSLISAAVTGKIDVRGLV